MASNGAIVITTKSGKGYQASGKRGLGISVNSGVAFNNVYVLPTYQNSYGGGPSQNWADTIDGQFIPDYALTAAGVPPWTARPSATGTAGMTTRETPDSAERLGSPPRTTSTTPSRRA